jgi:hypothetical protein
VQSFRHTVLWLPDWSSYTILEAYVYSASCIILWEVCRLSADGGLIITLTDLRLFLF